MRRGTIFKNLWAGYETYLVYLGRTYRAGKSHQSDTEVYQIIYADGKWHFKVARYASDFAKDTEHYPVVGYIDLDNEIEKFTQSILKGVRN